MVSKNTKHKTTEWRKYNADDKLWIPYFYIMYHYWWRFLKIAYEEKRIIRWKFYQGWGNKQMFDTTFRTWWKYHYKKLFAQKEPSSKDIRFPMTTNGRIANSLKTTIEVYKFKNIKLNKEYSFTDYRNEKVVNLGSYMIYDNLCKKRLDKFFTLDKDLGKAIDIGIINRNIKRHRSNCEKILKNVCVGKFP